MSGINKVIIQGNLTRDPQVKFLPSQTQVAEFGIACNRKFRTQAGEDREEVTFVDCTAFGKTGENIAKFFTKGKGILIDGRLKFDSWDDKQGGGKRSKLTVVVDNFHFVGGPRDGDGGDNRDGMDQRPFVGGAERPASRPGREEQRGRTGLPDARPVARRDPRADQRARNATPAAAPYDDETQFAEADIPF